MTRGRAVLAAFALGVAAFVAHLSAARLEFAADDFLILGYLQQLDGLANAAAYFKVNFYAYYRPLVFLSYAFDAGLWGLSAAAFHLTNIALHGVNTALVYGIGRRLGDRWIAGLAAILFAMHPATHEAAFWVAGRFDLLSTTWILAALLLLWSPRPALQRLALPCFALALLSKESAAAVVILGAAHGVIIERRDQRWALGRLVPLVVVSALYVLARNQAGLEAVGGAQRLGKVAMLVAAVVALLWLARKNAEPVETPRRRPLVIVALTAIAAAVVLGAAVALPRLGDQIGPSLGFATYAAYLLGPLGFLPVPALLDPNRLSWAVLGVAGVAGLAGAAVAALPWLRRHPPLLLAAVFIIAALVPVSAMPGETHLYLAAVGASLAAALGIQMISRPQPRGAVAVIAVVVCGWHLAAATGRWQRATAMTRGAAALVASNPNPCAERDIVFLTSPSGVDGVPCNLNYETFGMLSGCIPRTLHHLLRVVRVDATVEVSRLSRTVIEMRVPDYRGNLVASEDLRNYRIQVRQNRATTTIATPIGELRTWPEGDAQLFRLTLNEAAAGASFYYYSGHQVQAVPAPAPGQN